MRLSTGWSSPAPVNISDTMIVRNFQRSHSTFPFSSETASSLSSRPGFGEQCIHHQLYGQFDLEIVCCDGQSGIHQAVLGHASKMMKEILIGDTMQLDNGDVLNVVNSRKEMRSMFLPDIKKSTVKNLLSVLYTGDVVMTSLEEAGELKALWRLLKIDLIHIKDLQILFETDSSNSPLDSCGKTSSDTSGSQVVDVKRKRSQRSQRLKRSRHGLHKTKRWVKLQPIQSKQKKPTKKKLLKIFERFLAQTLKARIPLGKEKCALDDETTLTSVENAESENMITTADNTRDEAGDMISTVQSRSTIIQPTTQMITQNTLSYEDQNFSYDIDLLASDSIEQETIYHQPQDTIYQAQDSIYETQDQSVCIPFMQEDQVHLPLQLPLSYLQRPSIFVPVSFPDQISGDTSSTFSFLSTPTEQIITSSQSPKPVSKKSRVNLKRKQEVLQEAHDTDGFALLPNLQNKEYPDILDSFMNSHELHDIAEDAGQIASRKYKQQIPKFRENNNWVGKLPNGEVLRREKPRQKVKLTISFCKKINLIKDYIPPNKRKIKLNQKFPDYFHGKTDAVSTTEVPIEKPTVGQTKCVRRLDFGSKEVQKPIIEAKTTTDLLDKTKVQEKSETQGKPFKKKVANFEVQKYEMDERLIETYLRNQSKLKVINKWKIDPFLDLYDKSNDKPLRRQHKIRTSLVDLPNVLESKEGKYYCPLQAKSKSKKKSTCLEQLREISRISALQAAKPLKTRDSNPQPRSEKIVLELLDNILKAAIQPKSVNSSNQPTREGLVVDILDNIISSVVSRNCIRHSK